MKANWKDKIANLWRKHRLSLRDERDNREMWYMYISPLSIVAGILALALVLFIVILSSVAYTPLLEFLPGYQGNRTRTILLENIVRLDSMERQLSQMKVYSDNIALIMEGKTPVMRTLTDQNQTTTDKSIVMPSVEDSILRAQIEGDGDYSIANQASSRRSVRESMELVSPLAGGVIVNQFSPRSGSMVFRAVNRDSGRGCFQPHFQEVYSQGQDWTLSGPKGFTYAHFTDRKNKTSREEERKCGLLSPM